MLSSKQAAHFKAVLESRIAEMEHTVSDAKEQTRALATRHADPADQAAVEYERQAVVTKANAARQRIKVLREALHRLEHGTYGECAECGAEIERKRLEALPWTRFCVKCQEAREAE